MRCSFLVHDNGQMIVTKRITKEMPPDVTAQIFWLKNRRPDKWRDKPQEKKETDDFADVITEAWERRRNGETDD